MVLFAGNTVCDPYLSTLEEFAKTRYTNGRYIYVTLTSTPICD